MQTSLIPTRSGDGTFILEIDPPQYTLFGLFAGSIRNRFLCAFISDFAELFPIAATCH
jgi:hypothetical protein